MGQTTTAAPLARCLWVLLTVTAGAGILMAQLMPGVTALGASIRAGDVAGRPFDDVLVQGCDLAVCGCAAWLWLATTVVAVGALRGRMVAACGVPRAWHRLVLVACGVALVGGLGAPAQADDGSHASRVDGLPLPDRASTTTHVSRVFERAAAHRSSYLRAGPRARPEVVVVRPGDTLWDLARSDLPPDAEDAVVAARVREIHRANRAVIGADPDLIRPHQRLRMPATTREETR